MAKKKVGPWEATDAMLRTATALQRRLGRVVEPAGITLSQYQVLRILREAGEPGLPTLAIRDRMIDDAPGVTRLLHRLERAGLARRERSTTDRRLVHCHATPAGLALLARLDAAADAVDRRGTGVLTGKEQRRLLRLLDAVRNERPTDDA
jgi:MarR family transcriptional regulator, organic hydroperoxide resistance regulator